MDSGTLRIWADELADIMERLAEPGSAITVDWPFYRYLSAHEFTSRSALEDLRQRGPDYFHARHVARTLADAETDAMRFGRHVHMRLLEPEQWAASVMVWEPLPKPQGAKGNATKKSQARIAYDSWKPNADEWVAKRDAHARAGGIVIKASEAMAIEHMSMRTAEHPICAWAFRSSGANEQTILWHHAETGLLIRCRLDRLLWHDESTAVIADVKTTTDHRPEAFSKAIHRYGYHRQAALYSDAVRALRPGADIHYELIAIKSSPPYSAACYSLHETVELDDETMIKGPLALGREQYTADLHELARRRSMNDWLEPCQRESIPINLPAYAYRTP